MSRSKSKDQTDPFNAGNPLFGDDGLESSSAGEQPPESWDYDGSSSSKRSKKKKDSKRNGNSSESYPSSSSSSSAGARAAKRSAEQEKKRQEQARRSANQRKGSDYSTQGQPFTSYEDSAQQTTRQSSRHQDKNKKSPGRRIAFWFIIIVFVLPCILMTVVPLLTVFVGSITNNMENSQNKEVVGELLDERLNSLDEDDDLREDIAADFDRVLIYYTDYDAEGLGLDAYEFADWLLFEFTYDLDGDDISFFSNGDGYASFYGTGRDSDAESEFAVAVSEYLLEADLCYFASDELDEEQRGEVQALYDEMLEDYDTSGTKYFSIDLEEKDDEWALDEDVFEEEIYEALAQSTAGDEVDYEERNACTAGASMIEDKLSSLVGDEELHAHLVNEFNDYLELYAHYDVEGLGLDVDALTDWYLSNVSSHIKNIYIYDSTMYALVEVFYVDDDDLDLFCNSVEVYLDGEGVEHYSDEELTDAQKEHIQELYEDFTGTYEAASDSEYGFGYLDLELTEEDGEWVLDEDACEEELEFALHF